MKEIHNFYFCVYLNQILKFPLEIVAAVTETREQHINSISYCSFNSISIHLNKYRIFEV